jgi:hypothetical protein
MKTNLFTVNGQRRTANGFSPFSLLRFSVLLLVIAVAGCKKDDDETPPLAASTQTWTFGNQTWSDAIHCSECNKETFEESYTDPRCRSYTSGGKTYYYYNWAYVDANKEKMCPSPWRVPTQEDFVTLVNFDTDDQVPMLWGYGGYAGGSFYELGNENIYYWSSTVHSSNTNWAYYYWYRGALAIEYPNKHLGMQVRCVK